MVPVCLLLVSQMEPLSEILPSPGSRSWNPFRPQLHGVLLPTPKHRLGSLSSRRDVDPARLALFNAGARFALIWQNGMEHDLDRILEIVALVSLGPVI